MSGESISLACPPFPLAHDVLSSTRRAHVPGIEGSLGGDLICPQPLNNTALCTDPALKGPQPSLPDVVRDPEE